MEAKLYLCATPIGNLEDITLRVIRTLNECDIIYAEDTRHSLRLLNKFGIKKPLFSCHRHNEREAAAAIAEHVKSGKSVAYISDAGMPGISDPGEAIIKTCIGEGIAVEVLPGASALLTAAVLSGISTSEICFLGFLPRDKKGMEEKLEKYKNTEATLIIYESPLRAGKTLNALLARLGDRPAALVRELTKLHEQAVRAKLSELALMYAETPPKGECVIVVEGASAEQNGFDAGDIEACVKKLLDGGATVSVAAKEAADLLGVKKNEAYKTALRLASEKHINT